MRQSILGLVRSEFVLIYDFIGGGKKEGGACALGRRHL